jgi:Protein of unknown function (DUF559)
VERRVLRDIAPQVRRGVAASSEPAVEGRVLRDIAPQVRRAAFDVVPLVQDLGMSKHDVGQRIGQVALGQAGAFSIGQASACGADRSVRYRRVMAGVWRRPAGEVFLLRDHPVTWHTRLWVALLEAGDTGAVGLQAAAQLLGLSRRWRDPVVVTKKRGRHHVVTTAICHETSWLPDDHIVTIDGLPCTNIARTLFDLAGDPKPWERRSEAGLDIHGKRIRRLMNDALREHGLTIDAMAAMLAALGKRGRPGTALIRRLLDEFGPDHTPTESGLEDMFLAVITAAGLELPEKQVSLGDDHVFTGRVDFVYRRARLIIEVDSGYHDGPDDRHADRWRDNDLHARGWRVIRVRYRDLVREPDRVVALIRRALRAAAA